MTEEENKIEESEIDPEQVKKDKEEIKKLLDKENEERKKALDETKARRTVAMQAHSYAIEKNIEDKAFTAEQIKERNLQKS